MPRLDLLEPLLTDGIRPAHWFNGRVLTASGEVIPGLYGAGRATSGVSVGGYSSGLSLGDGTFFGRRAGRAASERLPGA